MSKITKNIHELTSLDAASVVSSDELIIYDVSTDETKKITADSLLNLNLPLPINKGGTGATSAAAAITNLGVVKSSQNTAGNMNNVGIGNSHWILAGTAGTSSAYAGDRISFHVGPDGPIAYDSTTQKTLWTVDFKSFSSNLTASSAEDTRDFWTRQGNGRTFYSQTGRINNQPSQYGHLLNYSLNGGSEIFQLWKSAPNGYLCHRGGNGNQGFGDWKYLIDNTSSTAFNSGGIVTSDDAGYQTDTYGNPVHKRSANTDYWCIKNNAGGIALQVNYQTGDMKNPGAAGWETITKTGSTNAGSLVARRYMGLVFLEGTGLKPGTTWTVITTSMPAKYCPQRTTGCSGWHNGNGNTHMTVYISTTGQVQISTQTTGASADGRFLAVYIPAN